MFAKLARLGLRSVALCCAGVATAQTARVPAPVAPARPAAGYNTALDRGAVPADKELRPDRDTRGSMQSYMLMLNYGRCASNIGRKTVSSALALDVNSAASRRSIVDLGTSMASCKMTGMSAISSLERGSLSEGAYHKVIKSAAGLPALVPGSSEIQRFLKGEENFNALRFPEDKPMVAATNCLVAEQPQLVDAILATEHGSAAELAAMDGLFPKAPNCAGPVRPTTISRSFLRAFLADSLYRYTVYLSTRKPV